MQMFKGLKQMKKKRNFRLPTAQVKNTENEQVG